MVGSAKKPLGGTIKSVAEEKQEEIRRKQRFAERQARLSKNENATHLVERIALDLDQIDLNEAVEMATNAAVLKHDDSTQFEKDAEKSGGGYQQILADEDDVTSDDDSVGRGGNNQCLENEREAFEEQSDNQTNKNTNDSKNISVVQPCLVFFLLLSWDVSRQFIFKPGNGWFVRLSSNLASPRHHRPL